MSKNDAHPTGEMATLVAEYEATKRALDDANKVVAEAKAKRDSIKWQCRELAKGLAIALGLRKSETDAMPKLRGEGHRKVLQCLDENGTMESASAIAKEVEMSPTGLPPLLKRMTAAGMVEKLKTGHWALTASQQEKMRSAE